MAAQFQNDWQDLLQPEFHKEYYLRLREFLKQEYSSRTIYPDMYDIFNAMHFTAYEDVKVVILGQDPYHGPGQARSGPRTEFFCKTRHRRAAFFAKHLSGTGE